jgi:cell wall-associated NlpC family hydrolase
VIAVGLRFRGYEYRHHHIPDWNPPADWQGKETAGSHHGKGVDCSNFTGFVYNLGFGIRISTDVHRQAELTRASVPALRKEIPLHRVPLPEDYAERIRALRTGDLLFIRDGKGQHISHVVLWVGGIGHASDDTPLILDSHGEGVKDSDGNHIPSGIQLRPYRKSSWYFRESSHALRVFPDNE